jgi:hypothetical protein
MNDIKDMCLINKDTVKYLLSVIKMHCDSYTNDEQKEIQQALNQDLSGMVVVREEQSLRDLICGARTFEIAQSLGDDAVQLLDYLRGAVDDLLSAAPKLGE